MMNTIPKIALGAWFWGAGAAGGDQVFWNHLLEEDWKPVFDTAIKCGLKLWDTAAVYGEETFKRILGNFVKIGVTKARQVEDAAKAAEITPSTKEVSELEAFGDAANVNTLCEWEKQMEVQA